MAEQLLHCCNLVARADSDRQRSCMGIDAARAFSFWLKVTKCLQRLRYALVSCRGLPPRPHSLFCCFACVSMRGCGLSDQSLGVLARAVHSNHKLPHVLVLLEYVTTQRCHATVRQLTGHLAPCAALQATLMYPLWVPKLSSMRLLDHSRPP